ncbi:hypothetical protein [Lewinella sp. 4G2]|uniref:hypothetical protein n=1 Tax=Lewinella sp. 4G2 TaxID=1803372 RepID=UPI0007B46FF2|nr:hypothetical protein [Lewinella sp. 4G2]OAV44200.1 hypothetical protein A3850_006695 [Lewinella sp. 4G2]
MRNYLLLLLPLLFVAACVNPPEYPIEPVITFEGVNKVRIKQARLDSGPTDSLEIHFSFTDGDGDLGGLADDSIDIFLQDSRLPIQTPFKIPAISREGTGNGISGDIFVTVTNSAGICCIVNGVLCERDPRFPTDTFSYSVQIRDRAGNLSNKIQTNPIEILCLE